jgi:hypothetical protein
MTHYEFIEGKHYAVNDEGCWLWLRGKFKSGYGAVHWYVGDAKKKWYTHRLSYTQSNGDIPEGHGVCHTCDVPSCINPEHLFVGTQKDNMQDCIKKGRFNRRKLTEEDVLEIRRLSAEGLTQTSIATRYPVGRHTIGNIVRNQQWRA